MSWRIRGTYFESCNCDAICPCRRIDGVPGGRSTHGECMGVLSWLIEDGAVDDVDLAGPARRDGDPLQRRRARARPWTWVLYLDRRATSEQRAALEAIFTGRLGGDATAHFPWAWKDERARRRAPGRDRRRPHAPAPAAADPRPRQRPHPRPLRRRGDGQLRHPGPRPRRARSSSPTSSSSRTTSCGSATAASAATARRSTTQARSRIRSHRPVCATRLVPVRCARFGAHAALRAPT